MQIRVETVRDDLTTDTRQRVEERVRFVMRRMRAQVMQVLSLKPDVDRAWPGKGVVYFRRLSARRTESRLSKIMGTPEYARMTIRNWNTTTTLLGLLDG